MVTERKKMSKILTLKGRKEGVIFCVSEGHSFADFFESFQKLIGSKNSFFEGGKIVGIEGVTLSEEEKEQFRSFVAQQESIELVSFDYSPEKPGKEQAESTAPAREVSDLVNVSLQGKMGSLEKVLLEEEGFMSDSLFFRGTVRSGVRLESEKNIVVIGDVNPGAELIAKSNIIVLGRLKGFAHAGSDGSKDKIIAAWKLQPTQIRIADYITMPPEGEMEDIDYPEMALIEDDRVIIKSYQ